MMQPPGSRPGISSLAIAPAIPPMTIQADDSVTFHHAASPFCPLSFNATFTFRCANARLRRKCRRWSKSSGDAGGRAGLLREVTYSRNTAR